jgi:hypothetical protein
VIQSDFDLTNPDLKKYLPFYSDTELIGGNSCDVLRSVRRQPESEFALDAGHIFNAGPVMQPDRELKCAPERVARVGTDAAK